MTDLITQTAGFVPAASKLRLRPRQSNAGVVVTVLGDILKELSGTLDNAIGALGIESLQGLQDLTSALNGLTANLKDEVEDLVPGIKILLEKVLENLSAALNGYEF